MQCSLAGISEGVAGTPSGASAAFWAAIWWLWAVAAACWACKATREFISRLRNAHDDAVAVLALLARLEKALDANPVSACRLRDPAREVRKELPRDSSSPSKRAADAEVFHARFGAERLALDEPRRRR